MLAQALPQWTDSPCRLRAGGADGCLAADQKAKEEQSDSDTQVRTNVRPDKPNGMGAAAIAGLG